MRSLNRYKSNLIDSEIVQLDLPNANILIRCFGVKGWQIVGTRLQIALNPFQLCEQVEEVWIKTHSSSINSEET